MKYRWLFLGLALAAAVPLAVLVWLGSADSLSGTQPGAASSTAEASPERADLARMSPSERVLMRASPGPSKLFGQVRDRQTGRPFAGATVVLQRRDQARAPDVVFRTSDALVGGFRPVVLGEKRLMLEPGIAGTTFFTFRASSGTSAGTDPSVDAGPRPQDEPRAENPAGTAIVASEPVTAVAFPPGTFLVSAQELTIVVPPSGDGVPADGDVLPPSFEGDVKVTSVGVGARANSDPGAAGSGAGVTPSEAGENPTEDSSTGAAAYPVLLGAGTSLRVGNRLSQATAIHQSGSGPIVLQWQGETDIQTLGEAFRVANLGLNPVLGDSSGSPWILPGRSAQSPAPIVELARVVTDDEGRFEFDCPKSDDCVLALLGEQPFQYEPAVRALGPIAPVCGVEIVWEVERVRRERLDGRLVDALTHEPVPYLVVIFSGADDRVNVGETDEEGRFRTDARFRPGTITIEYQDAEDAPVLGAVRSFEFLAEGTPSSPLEFAVHVGPTLRFSPRLGSTEEAEGLLVRVVGARSKDSNELVEPRWHTIRTQGNGFWMRFPAAVSYDAGARVELVTADGLLFGSDALAGEPLSDVNPREIRFALRASCAGYVFDAEFDRQAGTRVRILDVNGNELAATTADDDGAFEFLGVDARRARTLEVSHADFTTAREPLQLSAGRREELTPTLGARTAPPSEPPSEPR